MFVCCVCVGGWGCWVAWLVWRIGVGVGGGGGNAGYRGGVVVWRTCGCVGMELRDLRNG